MKCDILPLEVWSQNNMVPRPNFLQVNYTNSKIEDKTFMYDLDPFMDWLSSLKIATVSLPRSKGSKLVCIATP